MTTIVSVALAALAASTHATSPSNTGIADAGMQLRIFGGDFVLE